MGKVVIGAIGTVALNALFMWWQVKHVIIPKINGVGRKVGMLHDKIHQNELRVTYNEAWMDSKHGKGYNPPTFEKQND